jgi:tetratricopeptide (TPR) repeat protein
MVRLLIRARARGNDPELYAGLVTTCRYCGLLDESVAAFEAARRLDPAINTSVTYTFYVRGDYARAIETDSGNPPYAAFLARYRLNDTGVIPAIEAAERGAMYEGVRQISRMYRLAMQGNPEALRPSLQDVRASGFTDPEGFYLLATYLARAGAYDEALQTLDRSVRDGFTCPTALRTDPFWDAVREHPAFVQTLQQAETASARAREAFERAGGAAVITGPSQ